jgi:uncharacterized protein YhbP (UPF0306 family)
MERSLKSAELKSLLEEYLALTTMTLATAGKHGEPHAAAVYFAADETFNLYYFSETSSQHALDSGQEPRAAVAIQAEVAGWQQIHGLQMRGMVRAVDSKHEWQAAWQLYREKFPFVLDLENVITTNQLYAFTASWIRLVDNRQGFGFKQEWEVNTSRNLRGEPPAWRGIRGTNG